MQKKPCATSIMKPSMKSDMSLLMFRYCPMILTNDLRTT